MIEPSSKHRIDALRPIISKLQASAIEDGLQGEEAAYFAEVISNLETLQSNCPKTYETDGQGENAKCVLHYFRGNSDFYVVELDISGSPHKQAYGVAVLNGNYPELGYFDLDVLLKNNFELDFFYDQQTVGEVMQKHFN